MMKLDDPLRGPARASRRRSTVAIALLMAATLSTAALAIAPVNADRHGVAIEGYDPVAYFDQGKPVEGSPEYTVDWHGATWRFASAEHRDAFAADPDTYAPQYGGYCAYAVSEGSTADIDPAAWTIRAGKLYLNYSAKIQKRWLDNVDERIRRGDANWPGLVGE